MKILIIGGTKFLGRHLVDSALARGHEVTLFNRGKQTSESDPRTETITGDRASDLERLGGRRWDAVIDTCGYLPDMVEKSAASLADSVSLYVFVSSIYAYADFSSPDFTEESPVATLNDEQQKAADAIDRSGDITAAVLGEMYGALKAQCEAAAEKAMPGRVLNVRPGLIVGPFDPTDRLTYWVMRVADGGEVLAPGSPDRFVQLIDARNLSDWIVAMIEKQETGIYNATGKPFEITMVQMLESIREATGSDTTFTWVDEKFLTEQSVGAWGEMPLYVSESDRTAAGFLSANIDRALEKGLSFRPLNETARDTFEWRRTVDLDLRAGIEKSRETELLAKWREQR